MEAEANSVDGDLEEEAILIMQHIPRRAAGVDLVAVAVIIAMIVDIRTMAMAVVEAGRLKILGALPRDQ